MKLKDHNGIMLSLIKNCEYYNLNEKQFLESINKILSKGISRKAYCNYKKNYLKINNFNLLTNQYLLENLINTSLKDWKYNQL